MNSPKSFSPKLKGVVTSLVYLIFDWRQVCFKDFVEPNNPKKRNTSESVLEALFSITIYPLTPFLEANQFKFLWKTLKKTCFTS